MTIKYTDIDLGLSKNPVSKDILKITDVESVKNSVRNLLLTKNYEIPFHPEMGSGIRDLLFDNWLPTSAATIEKNIAFILKNYEPRVALIGLEIFRDPSGSSIRIDVYIMIRATSQTTVLNLILTRTR
mgnify:CR=1 FL=1|jgi:phage baseplate assembly protein W